MSALSLDSPDLHSSSEEYARRFAGDVGEFFLTRQENSVSTLLSRVSARTILDVGGGHAQIAVPLAERGYSVTVLGSDQSCASRLSAHLSAGKLKFQVGKLLPIACDDKSFDLVVSLRILSHMEDWRGFIRELCRVATVGVIVDYPPLFSFNFLTPLLFKIKKKIEGNTRDYTIFTHAEVKAEFANCGFAYQGRINQFFFPMGIHRKIKNVKISRMLETSAKALGLTALFGAPSVGIFKLAR